MGKRKGEVPPNVFIKLSFLKIIPKILHDVALIYLKLAMVVYCDRYTMEKQFSRNLFFLI